MSTARGSVTRPSWLSTAPISTAQHQRGQRREQEHKPGFGGGGGYGGVAAAATAEVPVAATAAAVPATDPSRSYERQARGRATGPFSFWLYHRKPAVSSSSSRVAGSGVGDAQVEPPAYPGGG